MDGTKLPTKTFTVNIFKKNRTGKLYNTNERRIVLEQNEWYGEKSQSR